MARRQLDQRPPLPGHGRVENYTDAFLTSAGCLLFMTLVAIWAYAGFGAALIAAFLLNYAINRGTRH